MSHAAPFFKSKKAKTCDFEPMGVRGRANLNFRVTETGLWLNRTESKRTQPRFGLGSAHLPRPQQNLTGTVFLRIQSRVGLVRPKSVSVAPVDSRRLLMMRDDIIAGGARVALKLTPSGGLVASKCKFAFTTGYDTGPLY